MALVFLLSNFRIVGINRDKLEIDSGDKESQELLCLEHLPLGRLEFVFRDWQNFKKSSSLAWMHYSITQAIDSENFFNLCGPIPRDREQKVFGGKSRGFVDN